jgi:GMP synthase (glutamine-hydrolysing)
MPRPDPHHQADSLESDRSGPIVVIKTGRTYDQLAHQRGDFEDWTARGLGVAPPSLEIIDVEAGQRLPRPGEIASAVITGSHSMVTDGQSWVESLAKWLRRLVEAEVPILGVCYGHQLLGHALGGRVGFHPDGPEVGTVEVDLLQEGESDPLLRGMPNRFRAHATHAQSVLALPDGAVLLARTAHEAHAAFRAGPCAWGVQFHPEYDEEIMRHYVREQRETLQALGRDPDRVEAEVRFADTGRILRRFAELSSRPRPGGSRGDPA